MTRNTPSIVATVPPERVVATEAARALIARLRAEHGEIFFYQSHGCCDGSAPMCFAPGEMTLNSDDLLLGRVDGVPFHASRAQCEYLEGTQLTLDVLPGQPGSFSLEDGSGLYFVARFRLWNDEEARALQAHAIGAP